MKMKIIGHRGAAGLALENTLEALRAGIAAGVDALEFDVRLTRDLQVVLCHDSDLRRISGTNQLVSELSLEELKAITLHNGETVPTLAEALDVVDTTPVIIEIKAERMVRQVLAVLDRYPGAKVTIASFKKDEMSLIKSLQPTLRVYVAARTAPLDIIYIARAIGADGLDLYFWILNPLTYYLARRNRLEIMVYTVNHPFFARFIHLFYPQVAICTDQPQLFIKKKRAERAR